MTAPLYPWRPGRVGEATPPAARSTVTYLPPTVHTTRYMTPHARARHIAHRVARSPFVTDVRTRLPWLPTGIGALTVTYFFVLVVRGAWIAAEMIGVAQ